MSDKIVSLDAQWVTRAFLVTSKKLSDNDYRGSMWSDAELKFTDTTIGGSIAINPPPQFTKFADLPTPSKSRDTTVRGMSRYYSEAIDDNSQVVHFRMGEPRFNSLASFYKAAYDPVQDIAAKSGRMNKLFFNVGQAAGFIVNIMSFKLLMVRAVGLAYRLLAGMPKSRYYYHTPTMHTYWGAVTTMLNQIAANRGIIPRVGGDSQKFLNTGHEFTEEAVKKMNAALPGVFSTNGQIDVYAMANKASRLLKKRLDQTNDIIESSNIGDEVKPFRAIKSMMQNQPITDGGASYRAYLDKWYDTDQASITDISNETENIEDMGVGKDVETSEGIFSGFTKYLKFLGAEANDGGMFASFRVNYTGSVSESFSNSVGDSEIASKLNSMSSSARNVNFNVAGGNIADGVGQAVDAVKSFTKGALHSIGLSGLAAVAGSAFFDIPKMWESSTANLPRVNYTIKLNSPYGNPISQLFNIYVPLCMLLCMALPKSTGKQTYTSPFLIEFYDKGRAQSRLGIIDSMSITRGTSSLAFNSAGLPLAMDVSFSIMDLSSIMHMPISMGINPLESFFNTVVGGGVGAMAGSVAGPVGVAGGAVVGATLANALDSGLFDDSTVYSDYLAVLAGLGVNDQIYESRKLKLKLTHKLANWKSWASISNLASFTGELPVPGRLASLFYRGVEF